ncbi:MauE/DoxX family redox-associated membrane protein [Mucilaginibacter pocheonensis]|uniref:Methylamine utilisation protein MauE domain-containing protein n=1 Tax=Mucilaginibacter pocheonensis TaxID=398050 RepID=A0ABU1TFS6_9SPHI|nr:MauE/DoxX family redox-associated membrane protein [Mucilaginibacter pocheonensis]MDR6943695.1 hypothetical protein [Mucilaginibacter pocheonensis]
MKRSDLPDLIAALLILMFAYAAFSKLFDFPSYKLQMSLQPLPKWSTSVMVFFLPASEIIVVSALIFRKTRLIGLYASVIMMLIFTGYVGLAMTGTFGKIPCSCGGVIRHMKWPLHFVFNLFFLFLSTCGLYFEIKERRFIGR